MTEKPSLLYVSPVVPLRTGNGLAMRAALVLEILTEWYRIRLVVLPLYLPGPIPVPPEIARLCEEAVVVPLPGYVEGQGGPGLQRRWSRFLRAGKRFLPRSERADVGTRPFRDLAFDVIHVFRLITIRFAEPYFVPRVDGGMPRRHLDLDDIESRTFRRIAQLYRENGLLSRGAQQEAEAEAALAWENQVLPQVNRVYVCSEADRQEILKRVPRMGSEAAEVCVLPNAARVSDIGPPAWEGAPFIFLFVGTLGYYPNQDALQYFGFRVWPLIRREACMEVDLNVVGVGAAGVVTALGRLPCVQVIGEVADVEPYYQRAHAVIVPVRAGGGTRIKVLEAFGYRRPVVSTSLGIEGIEARDEEHVLLGDTPEEFARQCLRLMDEPDLRERLASNAFSLFKRAYTPEAVARTAASYLPPPRSGA
jgi:glycosyltransferase involved in cell wall biosynthesis